MSAWLYMLNTGPTGPVSMRGRPVKSGSEKSRPAGSHWMYHEPSPVAMSNPPASELQLWRLIASISGWQMHESA